MKKQALTPTDNTPARPMVVMVILGSALMILLLVGMAVWPSHHHGKSDTTSVATIDPAPSQELVIVATSSVGSTSAPVALLGSDLNSGNSGLITFRLNPSFSTRLPSPDDAQRAMVMNKQFLKMQQNGK